MRLGEFWMRISSSPPRRKPRNVNTDVSGPYARSIKRPVEYESNPSSSHASSNSLLATRPYQNWWPNSCTTTSSGTWIPLNGHRFSSADVPAVMNVGYSIPPDPRAPGAGSTIVSVAYGYRPYHKPKYLIAAF